MNITTSQIADLFRCLNLQFDMCLHVTEKGGDTIVLADAYKILNFQFDENGLSRTFVHPVKIDSDGPPLVFDIQG